MTHLLSQTPKTFYISSFVCVVMLHYLWFCTFCCLLLLRVQSIIIGAHHWEMADLLEALEGEIRWRIAHLGETFQTVSEYLQSIFPGVRGISTRSIRRFCHSRDIHYRSRLSTVELERLVQHTVTRVGHSYGRRSLHGLLRSQGIHVSQSRIGAALRNTFPLQHSVRRHTLGRALNPIPYRADFYGQKIHFDQNEKLVMYGIVHVAAVDGHSRKIVGFYTMPRKNSITIYNNIFRPLLLSEGVWDQLRCDHGSEFCLIATVQEYLSGYRGNQQRLPVLLTTSRQNHRVERLWVEVNSRINYPIKTVLVAMEEAEYIDMRNNIHRFAVSWVGIQVAASPISTFVEAWNDHRIPGPQGGIPSIMASNTCQIQALPSVQVPSTSEAIQLHESARSQLTRECTFGTDPLTGYHRLQALRQRDFYSRHPSMEAIFTDVLHNSGLMLQDAILTFIELSNSYSSLIP